MLFFTNILAENSKFCLLNIKNYSDERKARKKFVFVDPGVNELKKGPDYPQISLLHDLIKNDKLEWNEWLSIDYPCDMNLLFQEEFIEKSIKNNQLYREKEKYICTIQSKFQDFIDFKIQFEYLKPIFYYKEKIVGIGNLCRIKEPNAFTDKVFSFLRRNQQGITWLHFYGLSKKCIEKYLSYTTQKRLFEPYSPWPWYCIISVDSTKWTRAVDIKLKKQNHGRVCCNNQNRGLFLDYYCEKLEEKTDLWW